MKPRSKAIIIFSPAFPANEADTTWLPSLQTFVSALNKNYSELKVIIFAFQYPHTTETYTWFNNRIIPFNGLHKKKIQRLFMWLNIFFEVRKTKREYNVVGILSMWCTECAFVAKYVSKFFRMQHFCWILGQDARKENTYINRIRPKASSLIAISDFLVTEFYNNHNIKPGYIIPVGINTALFSNTVHIKDIDIVGVGSLSFLKQYDLFVQIIAALKKDLPGIKALLCGDGEARGQIETMIKKFSLGENVILTGVVQHLEALQIMQRARILLHPSSYEGFSTACLEALYAGAHIISFVQPMHHNIKNWHVVKTTEEMRMKALELLNKQINHEPVLVYSIDDSSKCVMKLFGYNS